MAARRRNQSVGDMVRSLGVVLAVVVVVVALTLRTEPDPVREIDYLAQLREARAAAGYDVLAPAGLGDGWRATSARVERTGAAVEWHLGFVTPSGDYAGVEQTRPRGRGFVDRFAKGADSAGRTRLGDRSWLRLVSGTPEPRALVMREGAVVTVVAGSAGWPELRTLARSLRTR